VTGVMKDRGNGNRTFLIRLLHWEAVDFNKQECTVCGTCNT